MRPAALTRMAVLCAAGVSAQAVAQDFTIQPVAGVPRQSGDGGQATAAPLWAPRGVSVSPDGTLYIADSGNARIRRVATDGVISTVAGSIAGFAGDNGSATQARLSLPVDAAFAANGDMYVVDAGNRRIRKVAGATGQITTLSGPAISGSGTPELSFLYPRAAALDSGGNLYVADYASSRVFKITPDGRGSVFAGRGIVAYFGDNGPAVNATLALPRGIAVDTRGNVYIADTDNNRIRMVDPNGVITTVAGSVTSGWGGDNGPALLAALNKPAGVAVDSAGNVFIADTGNHRIRRVQRDTGIITTVAGTGVPGFAGDNGPATAALFNAPEGVAVDPLGNVYVADTGNHRARRIAGGVVTTVAGVDRGAGDNGPALEARLFQPSGIALDSSGNLYVSDTGNNRIRRVSPDGRITALAAASLNQPGGLTTDRAGNLYVADTGSNTVRRITPSGVVSLVAGTGEYGNVGDGGPATLAQLNSPAGLAFDAAGRLLIADSGNHRIRLVDTAGNIQPFAGNADGLPGYQEGSIGSARFNYPRGLAVSSNGEVYVSDFFNNRIRRVTLAGAVETFAGTGLRGWTDGPRLQAAFSLPSGLAFDSDGNLFVADSTNDRIRRIAAGTGMVRTVAGTGGTGDSGDGGPALAALLAYPRGVVADPAGTVFFSDQDNDRVRKLVTVASQSAQIQSVQNAASLVGGAIAPGEIVSIKGVQFITTGRTRVLFDGVDAPILYASATQLNVVVPNEVAGRGTSSLTVEVNGQASEAWAATVREAAIGVFTTTQNGAGQAAALNQDGSVNAPGSGVERGSVAVLFVTGGGAIPGLATGQAAAGPMNASLPFRVQIGGQEARVSYAGAAPGWPGLMQVNAEVPASVQPGDSVPVFVLAGTFGSQNGVTIAVK